MAVQLRPGRGGLRALRTTALITTAVEIAVVAHLVVDGCVDAPAVAVVTGLSLPSGWVLTQRETSLPRLLGWLCGVQLAAHLILTGLCRGSALVPRPATLLAHVAAVAVAALLLRWTDACVWSAGAWARAAGWVLVLLGSWQSPPTPRPSLRCSQDQPWVVATWKASCLPRRGPPVGAAAS